ncbi:MAG: hypothetical protein DWG76_06035 [Chloroflexi bacterium]|nr:hypothetical protein [Chloroflexota bacterium]
MQTAPTQSDVSKQKSLGRLVGAYKTHTTVQLNKVTGTPSTRFWQRNYYERVIRNQSEFEATYDYILNNPKNWGKDEEFKALSDDN